MMRIIKISTDLELTVHEFPTGTYEQQNKFLRELIGNYCNIYEHVMPTRLYTELHMGNILFVGEKWNNEGIDFCGIADSIFELLELQLNNMIYSIKATKEAMGK